MGYRVSPSNDTDSINAAALDSNVPTPALDDAVEQAKKLTAIADSQQTKDTSFLNANDLLSALGVGISAFLSGGASLAFAGSAATAAALDSSDTRREKSEAEANQRSSQFLDTTLKLHGGNVDMYEAQMRANKPSSGGSMTGATALRILETAALGPSNEYATIQGELRNNGFGALAALSQESVRAGYAQKFHYKNFNTLTKRSVELASQGYLKEAREVMAGQWGSAIPEPNLLLHPDDPMTDILISRVVDNPTLTDTQREVLMTHAQLLKQIDPEGYLAFGDVLGMVSTNYQQIMDELAAHYDFLSTTAPEGADAFKRAIAAVSATSATGRDPVANILDFSNTVDANNRLLGAALQAAQEHMRMNNGTGTPRRLGTQVPQSRATKRTITEGKSGGTPRSEGPAAEPTTVQGERQMRSQQELDAMIEAFDEPQRLQFDAVAAQVDQLIKENPIFLGIPTTDAITFLFNKLHTMNAGLARLIEIAEFRTAIATHARIQLETAQGASTDGSE